MAVRLSSYYWFRNNYLVRSLEDTNSASHFFGKDLDSEDKKALQLIVKELDKLKEGSHCEKGSPVVGEHVVVMNVAELKDVTDNPKLAATYFEGIHSIMKKYWVQTDLYNQLGKCFNEIGVEPSSDTREAIGHANHVISSKRFGGLERMCWS